AAADLDASPVRQRTLGYPRVVYQRAVEAAQIANQEIVPLPEDNAVFARIRRVGQRELVPRVASDSERIRRDRIADALLRAGDHEQSGVHHILYCSPFGYRIHLEIQSGSRIEAARVPLRFAIGWIIRDLRETVQSVPEWQSVCLSM